MLVLLRSSRLVLLPRVSLARGRRKVRVRLPFPLPPEAPAALEVKVKAPGKSQPDWMTLPVRVGGCLAPHWRQWQAVGAEIWVVTVLWDGYRVPFKDSPAPLSCTLVSFPTYRAGSPRAQALWQEVEGMLAKGVLEIARDPGPGFYSRLFLVEKASGGWRPVIDLSHLNDFVQLTPFKMETVALVLLSVKEGDFLASLDLKDVYFQIPTHEVHVGGDGLPVLSPVLRTVDCSPGLHQGLRGSVSVGTLPQDQTSPLSGRLVGPLLFGEEGQAGSPVAPLALSHPRDCDKREEVRSRFLAGCEVPWYDHRYRCRQGFSVSGASREIPIGGGEILCYGISPGSALAGDPRSPGFARAPGSSRSSSDALIAVAAEDALVPRVRPSLTSGDFASLLLRWTESFDVHLDARYLPGESNVLADLLSRRGQVLGTEWAIHPQVARSLLRVWGNPSINLFATCLNAKLLLYCSLVPDPQAVFEDAFRHPWDDLDLYAFPPFPLVGRVIARVQESSLVAMTLVAPLWPEKEWFADLLLLLTQPPLALPCWDRLLRQPHCSLFHRGVHALNLHSWTLKRHYRKSGFSGRAARVMAGVLRESSSRLYQSRWKIFCGWCRGRGVAPVNATVPVVVDFLIHLRQDKGLSVSAVKGYCSALNNVGS